MTDLTPARPVAVDLFAGAGGLSLGLEQAGFDVAAAVEYDPVHAATHEYNFPLTKVLCADVARPLRADEVMQAIRGGLSAHGRDASNWDGQIDLVAGGPPCQGFSLIGKRLVDDKRNQLVFHFYRLVAELQPRYFIMENVPGMTKGGHASVLDELIHELEEAGYHFSDSAKYRVLNAADFGVPQERHRMFLIGTRNDQAITAQPPAATVLPVAKRYVHPVNELPLGSIPLGPTVGDAIFDLPNLTDFRSLQDTDSVALSPATVESCRNRASRYARFMRGIDLDDGDYSYARNWDDSVLTASTRTEHSQLSQSRFSRTPQGQTEPVSRYYRLDEDGLCNTLRAGSGSERGAFTSPRPIHPRLPRVLSNREAARLHSFPDWFRPHATKWHGFRQIGNAVAPLVGRAVGRAVMDALGAAPSVPLLKLNLGDVKLLTMTMSEAANYFGAARENIPAQRRRLTLPQPAASPIARTQANSILPVESPLPDLDKIRADVN